MNSKYPATLSWPADVPVCVEAGRWALEYDEECEEDRLVAVYTEPFTLACALVVSGKVTPEEVAELVASEQRKLC